jgi:tetratricopeptide (TPR) repeat protein
VDPAINIYAGLSECEEEKFGSPGTASGVLSEPNLGGKTEILAKLSLSSCRGVICLALLSALAFAQAPASPSSTGPSSPVERGIDLAGKRHCEEALPLLNEVTPGVSDKQLKYRAQIAIARCGIRKKDGRTTVNALMALRHDYPEDPEVLYLTTQVFLEIAETASQDLARIAPNSYQVLELEAETLESQNKWQEAAAIYRKILETNPKLPNIHFRLGRVVLAQPETPATTEEARKEFEQELAIDPTNASAEFWLGENSRRDGQWSEAVPHFTSALKLDPALAEAMLALGMTFNSEGRFSDAIAPLERYTKIVPQDPAGHYQLALAYARTGRKEDSAREMTFHRQLSEKKQAPPASPDNVPR